MAKITRQEARDLLFGLLFETEFRSGDDPNEIYSLACEDRDIPNDKYIRETFFGILFKSEVLDAVISKYANGWRADRLSKVSRTVIRIAAYEILFVEDIPANVSISQAVELSLKYGEDKAKQFVNGVLSGLNKDVQARSIDTVIDEAVASLAAKSESAKAEGEEEETAENA
ncbi:MAG: transcription antitermination factor NusB [Clostridia bacterium]|nr:transcription antitermination factor NusB [Clostridia bacterium]